MERWIEFRTAYHVARLGTVSAAADALGVHRATVNRHIDRLEADLGAKLFQRHGRGYALTEAGEELLRVAGRADQLVSDFATRTRAVAGGLTGEVVVTALRSFAGYLMPALGAFRGRHPNVRIRLLAQDSLARLEVGEAHVAIRAGERPNHSDYVVQPFACVRAGLYAHRDYVARKGIPRGASEFGKHDFVANPGLAGRVSFETWMAENVPSENIVLETTNPENAQEAVAASIGIGFLPETYARDRSEFVEVAAPGDQWSVNLWLVTHVDLHRTAKVQSMVRCLKQIGVQASK